MKIMRVLACLAVSIAIYACGGVNGGGTPTALQPATAVIKIATQGAPSAGPLGAVQAILHLPAGVTVKATPDSENLSVYVTDAGVVTASGVAAGANTLVISTYTAATGATAASVSIRIVNANGFGVGEFAAVNCDVAAGSVPKASEFSVTEFSAWDTGNAAPVNGLALTFTADIH